eukprot:762619-Hanusia_phi.AAC.2
MREVQSWNLGGWGVVLRANRGAWQEGKASARCLGSDCSASQHVDGSRSTCVSQTKNDRDGEQGEQGKLEYDGTENEIRLRKCVKGSQSERQFALNRKHAFKISLHKRGNTFNHLERALQKTGLAENAKFVGSSAGSLVGLALALDLDFDQIKDFQLTCVERTHGSLQGALRLKEYLDEIMDQMLPDGACEKISDRSSLGTMPFYVKVCMQAAGLFELFDGLNSFCKLFTSMAPLCGMPFKHEGEVVYDGAVSDWYHNGIFTAPKGHQSSNEREITVTPFWFSRADIKPSQYVPIWWALYPPRVEDFEWVYHLGYQDGMKWSMQHIQTLSGPRINDVSLHSAFRAIHGKPTGAFTRSFGYRSILRIVPSSTFDLADVWKNNVLVDIKDLFEQEWSMRQGSDALHTVAVQTVTNFKTAFRLKSPDVVELLSAVINTLEVLVDVWPSHEGSTSRGNIGWWRFLRKKSRP